MRIFLFYCHDDRSTSLINNYDYDNLNNNNDDNDNNNNNKI